MVRSESNSAPACKATNDANPASQDPSDFPRRILLAVTGLSPQIVTETLYALAVNTGQRRPFVPTEIHVVTTQEGFDRARLTLLSEQPGWFYRLCADYNLIGISFGVENIHILRDAVGNILTDIRTPADNEIAADTITEYVREFTSEPDTALHVSIAGGRKTMGFYAGYALSLYGRSQDQLSHVLVSPPFESLADFFYPTPQSAVIYTNDPKSRPLDTKDAKVTLAEIPFVSLRHGLPLALIEGRARFSESVDAARLSLGAPSLDIDPRTRRVRCGGRVIELPPAELALLVWFARRTVNGQGPVLAPTAGAPELEYAAQYLSAIGELGNSERTHDRLIDGMDKAMFEQTLSRLRRRLKDALGAAAHTYLPKIVGKRRSGYALPLPREAIHFVVIPIEPDRTEGMP